MSFFISVHFHTVGFIFNFLHIYIYIYIYIYIILNGGIGRAIYHDLLIRHRLYVARTSGPVVEFRLLHTVVVVSISRGGDHGTHWWWDLIRPKQLFSAAYVVCRCLPDFLVMAISNMIYINMYIYITRRKVV